VAYPSPQEPAPVPAPQSRPGGPATQATTLAGILLLPLLMLFGFLLCYLLPFHAPAPHGVKVAVAGWVSAGEIGAGLDQQAPGAFDVIPVTGPAQARQQVLDQAAQAAFVVNGVQATLYTAKADGAVLEQAVIAAFTPVAHADYLTLNVVELVPTVPGDAVGNSLFFLGLAWTLSPYLLVVSLVMQGTILTLRDKLNLIAATGAFASIAGFLIAYWLGAVPGQALSMLYGFLNFEAVALTVFGLSFFVGRYLIPVALTLFVFVNAPSSGGAIPYQMVPTFFDWLHPVMPLGNLIDALRSISYFDGTNMIRPTLVLCAWIALGAALITIPALPRRASQRPAPAPGPAGPPGRELPGPAAAAAEPIILQAPIAYAVPAANGTDGPGHRPPTLSGTVTDTAGTPIWAAGITIIDTDGHQLTRTSTDRTGRYAIPTLPGGTHTVLLSPPGQTPLATRVTLTTSLPVRQDFALPHPPQGVGRDAGISYQT
jgi:Carboxypeptidase regulatory-like domain